MSGKEINVNLLFDRFLLNHSKGKDYNHVKFSSGFFISILLLFTK